MNTHSGGGAPGRGGGFSKAMTIDARGLPYRELMEHLKDKEPSYYYTDILIPNGKTLGDFIDNM